MRPEKANIVSELSEALKRSTFVLVTDYRGMKVSSFSELRSRLTPAHAEVHVVKNSFLKLAMADSGFPEVADEFAGQTAVVTGEADVAPVAKIFKSFATEFKLAALRVGFVDRAVLSTAELETLADLPTREILQAQFLGLLLSPATRLVRLFNEPGAALARLLNAKAEKEGAPAA
jgi:large subunit ribosomal protein L10